MMLFDAPQKPGPSRWEPTAKYWQLSQPHAEGLELHKHPPSSGLTKYSPSLRFLREQRAATKLAPCLWWGSPALRQRRRSLDYDCASSLLDACLGFCSTCLPAHHASDLTDLRT